MGLKLKLLGSGGFGRVYELTDYSHVVVKKVKLYPSDDKDFILREVTMLRQVCKQRSDDYKKISPCRSQAIASFVGCILDKNVIYEFHEKMTWDFANSSIRDSYLRLKPYKRVIVMLDIIDRFIELHKLKIVHSDIKPQNIMLKSKDFSEIRIIDLGLANFEGKDFLGGTEGFRPPETYSSSKKGKILRFANDVFALGMTLAGMEGDFSYAISLIQKGCFRVKEDINFCSDMIDMGLRNAFSIDKGLGSIFSVISQAVDSSLNNRFDSMEKFSDELLKKFKKLDGAESFIKVLVDDSQKVESPGTFQSYWRNKLIGKKEPPKSPVVEPSEGIFERIIRFFTCGSKKPKKNKKYIVAIPIDNRKKEAISKKIIL